MVDDTVNKYVGRYDSIKKREMGDRNSSPLHKRPLDVKRLDGLRLQPKLPEKGLIAADISRQKIVHIH